MIQLFFAFFLFFSFVSSSYSAQAILYRDDGVVLDGRLQMTTGSYIMFPDGSVQTTAASNSEGGIVGPPGPAGPAGPVGPAGPAGASSSGQVLNIFIPNNVDNFWYTDDVWSDFQGLSFGFFPSFSDNVIRFDLNINVGIYNLSWCSLGLFVDNSEIPFCTANWSGVPYTTVFNNQSFTCFLRNLSLEQHVISFRHKSQFCHYFNGRSFDDPSNSVFITEFHYQVPEPVEPEPVP